MDSTTTQPNSRYPSRPPLSSPASVLDNFVVDGAVVYALTATLSEMQPDSLETLHAWRDYFLEVFQCEPSYRQHILQCQPQDAQRNLDAMHELLQASWIEEPFKVALEVALLRLAEEHLLYPRRLRLDDVLLGVEQLPLRSTVGTVIQGSFNGAIVGIKTSGLRLEDSAGIVSKHILSWTLLKHENVLPLHGVCILSHYNKDGPFNHLGLVFPFLENGNIIEFLDKNPGADRRSLILDVAAGMSYLHENGIVHGRIHCHNILVTDTRPPRACLSDFGLAHVLGADTSLRYKYTFDSLAGKRMSYLLGPEDHISTNSLSRTEASDILTGHLVLTPVRMEMSRSFGLVSQSSESENMIERLMMDCWQPDAIKRPSARQIIERLKTVIEMDKRAEEERILRLMDHVQTSLTAILNNLEHHKRLISMDKLSTQRILDAFQELLNTGKFRQTRTQLIAAMRRISINSGLYPAQFSLDDSVTKTVRVPITAGGCADIYKVPFRGKDLCLKMLRILDYNHLTKAFAKEVTVWAQLSHPNVLPFLGIIKYRERLCFVSCWATNGNLESYLKYNPSANRILLCSDTAAGVEYLHKNDVVHGDLKGVNVLVDASGRAALGDFGLSSVTDPQILQWTSQPTVESKGGTTRWQAPELLKINGGAAYNTRESDVFAWASICYEVFTGRMPYFESLNPVPVMNKILRGITPTRPSDGDIAWRENGLTDTIWNVMQDCWKFEPSERLNMTEVNLKLQLMKPVDTRSPMDWKEDVSMFRNAQSEDLSSSFWLRLNEVLSPIISASGS